MTTGKHRNLTFDEIEIGHPFSVSRPLSRTDVEALALVSGDVDPFHVEAGDARHDEPGESRRRSAAEAILSTW